MNKKNVREKHTPARAQSGAHALFSAAGDSQILDSPQLHSLEQSFRQWAGAAPRSDIRISRKRILAIFLLIRHTGARLGEILELDAAKDLQLGQRHIVLGTGAAHTPSRTVPLPSALCRDLKTLLADPGLFPESGLAFNIDPGHVRRKFYERAQACGLPRDAASPAAIRRARTAELLRANMPVPVAQSILGQSTPNLTISNMNFSETEMARFAQRFIDRESRRKTSARNIFYGIVSAVQTGDIQSLVELTTFSGATISTVITNNSVQRLNIEKGLAITAEVKAPWVVISRDESTPRASACNVFHGRVQEITRGKILTEVLVLLDDETEICSVITDASRRRLMLAPATPVWVMFNSFAVILQSG